MLLKQTAACEKVSDASVQIAQIVRLFLTLDTFVILPTLILGNYTANVKIVNNAVCFRKTGCSFIKQRPIYL